MHRANDLGLCLAMTATLLASACSKKGEPQNTETAPESVAQSAGQVASETSAPKQTAQDGLTSQPKGPTGSIKGKVSVTGDVPEMPELMRGSDPVCDTGKALAETIMVDAEGGLANVLVRIKPGTVPAWTPTEPIVVDQVDCMYRPRVQAGVRGQTVQVLNSDETTHNVHARYLTLGERKDTETLINRAQPAGVKMEFELGDEPIAKLVCNYHAWMQGFVLVSDNPYAGVSGTDGQFEVQNVPVGEHSVEVWHEFYGVKEATVTVEEGGSATLDMSYDAVTDNPRGGSR